MAITAAAEKTTAAFFMGFPFTKIVVDKGNTSQDCGFGFALRQGHDGILPIETGTALRCPLPVPSRGTPNPNTENASRRFVPAKYEIVNFMSGVRRWAVNSWHRTFHFVLGVDSLPVLPAR
jgi:hypothetical protein